MSRPRRSGCVDVRTLCWVLLAVLTLAVGACSADGPEPTMPPPAPEPDEIKVVTGSLPFYHLQMKERNDASGAVFLADRHQLLVVDDGGDDLNPDLVPLYLTDVAAMFQPVPRVSTLPPRPDDLGLSVSGQHKDLEAATFDGSFVYITSSMPDANEPNKADPKFRVFSRFRLEGEGIRDAQSIEPRAALMEGLARPTADPWFADWLRRWSVDRPNSKDCGLNVEALSRTPNKNQLLVGLRSPHYGPDYCVDDEQTRRPRTRNGAAILLSIDVSEFQPAKLQTRVEATLDLGGLGFRGLEFSPTAKGYFLTAGAVEAGFDYDFFFWNGKPGAAPIRLSDRIPQFTKLCRPESVEEVEEGGRRYLLVLSEDSGLICESPPAPYNYLLIELNRAFLEILK